MLEWLRDRQEEQAQTEIVSLKEILMLYSEPIDFPKMDFCSFFTSPCHEFTRFKKKIIHVATF
jgi:hypothetical protein